jgi:hypothetical protein
MHKIPNSDFMVLIFVGQIRSHHGWPTNLGITNKSNPELTNNRHRETLIKTDLLVANQKSLLAIDPSVVATDPTKNRRANNSKPRNPVAVKYRTAFFVYRIVCIVGICGFCFAPISKEHKP